MRHRELGAGGLAERLGAVEAALGAGAAPLQRRIERDATEARRTTKSRSAWKRVASAQSICSSEKTSMSSSTTNTCLTSPEEQNTAAMALRASPGLR